MAAAYVDTSCLVTIALGERGAAGAKRLLEDFDEWISSNLLEAEFRAALTREGVAFDVGLLGGIGWVFPDRPLRAEIGRVLSTAYVRGADCWHLATALYVTDGKADMAFLTLDERQRGAALALGFELA
jgi:hypothetical protein